MRHYEEVLKICARSRPSAKCRKRASKKQFTKSGCAIWSPARNSRRPSLASFVRKRKPSRSSSANERSNTQATPTPGTSIVNPACLPSPLLRNSQSGAEKHHSSSASLGRRIASKLTAMPRISGNKKPPGRAISPIFSLAFFSIVLRCSSKIYVLLLSCRVSCYTRNNQSRKG
jgi:hypothetical protein